MRIPGEAAQQSGMQPPAGSAADPHGEFAAKRRRQDAQQHGGTKGSS
jgi:hypothetical protein